MASLDTMVHMVRAALYCRISSDRSGDRAGIKRQREDLVRLCEARGWEWAEPRVFTDNDQSAYGAKSRPAWKRMLAAADAGEFDVLAAWHDDRLWRDVSEQQLVFSILRDCGITTISTPQRDYDTSSADDQFISGIQALSAQKESADKSRRLRRKLAANAMEGKPHGGVRPFGFSNDEVETRRGTHRQVEHVPGEVAQIQEAAQRILRGESLASIARRWNAAGSKTAMDKPWRGRAIKRVLMGARVAGLREHHGEVLGDAVWEPIISRETWEAVRVIIDGHPKINVGHPERRYLLTGIARCALCGHPMRGRPRSDKVPSYLCLKDVRPDGSMSCGRMRVTAAPVDDYIRDAIVTSLEGDGLRQALAAQTGTDVEHKRLVEELTQEERRLQQVEERFLEGEVSRKSYLTVRQRVERSIEGLRRHISRNERSALLVDLPTDARGLEGAWNEGDIEWRRSLLLALVDHVVIHPASRRGAPFTPDRATIEWRV